MPSASTIPPTDPYAPLRRLLLGLVLLGALGLVAELLLLEHYDSPWQWAPLALLGLVPVAVVPMLRRPGFGVVRAFRALMALCVAAGALGVYWHLAGNVEFALEEEPARHGLALFWEAIRGATPALAPGALAQLGVLGLLATLRHPALRPSPSDLAVRGVVHLGTSR